MSEALLQHYKQHHDKLVKRLAFRAGTVWDAEDVVQEAYANALKYFNSFDGTDFNKWFSTILTNCLKEHKNNEKGFGKEDFEEDDFEAVHASHQVKKTYEEVKELIESKPDVQKEILKMWFNEELSSRDISKITGHTHGNCRQIIKRFRDELKGRYK